jgi:hypothetical protein
VRRTRTGLQNRFCWFESRRRCQLSVCGLEAGPWASNPLTPVRFRSHAPDVAPRPRDEEVGLRTRPGRFDSCTGYHAGMAERLGSGTPSRTCEFESRCPLHCSDGTPMGEARLPSVSRPVRFRRCTPRARSSIGRAAGLHPADGVSIPLASTIFAGSPRDEGVGLRLRRRWFDSSRADHVTA